MCRKSQILIVCSRPSPHRLNCIQYKQLSSLTKGAGVEDATRRGSGGIAVEIVDDPLFHGTRPIPAHPRFAFRTTTWCPASSARTPESEREMKQPHTTKIECREVFKFPCDNNRTFYRMSFPALSLTARRCYHSKQGKHTWYTHIYLYL